MDEKENIKEEKKVISIVDDVIFFIIIILLSILSIAVIWQRIFLPDKIPSIFGYKFFMVLDGKMDKSIAYGDLLITHNVNPYDLEKNDVIAFRNKTNKVTVHRISDITNDAKGRQFEMLTASDEVGDTKYVRDSQVEGIIIHRIPKLGAFLIKFQEPYVFFPILFVVLIIGMMIYRYAWKLDKRDLEKVGQN